MQARNDWSLDNGYVVLDLETTGLDCYTDVITEIGVMKVVPKESTILDSVLVQINRPLPQRIINLTGITDAELKERGIFIDEALRWLKGIVGGLPIVGHNIFRFDRHFLLETIKSNPGAVKDLDLSPERFIDTKVMYRGYRMEMYKLATESHFDYAKRLDNSWAVGLKSGLSAVYTELCGKGVDGIQAHRAAGDVVKTQAVFDKLSTMSLGL